MANDINKPLPGEKPFKVEARSKSNDPTATVRDLAKTATPKQIREWIDLLEDTFAQKKQHVRDDLKEKVGELMAANGYTIEELFGARVLPTVADLAKEVELKSAELRKRKDKMINSTLG